MIQLTNDDIDTLILDYLLRKYPHTAYTFKNESNLREKSSNPISTDLEEVISLGVQSLYIQSHLHKPLCNALFTISEKHTCIADDLPSVRLLQFKKNIELIKYNNYLIVSSANNLSIYNFLCNSKEFYLVPIINHSFDENILYLKKDKNILYICLNKRIYLLNLFYFFQVRGYPMAFGQIDKKGRLMQFIEKFKYKLCVDVENLKETINNLHESINIDSIDTEDLKTSTKINERIKHIFPNKTTDPEELQVTDEPKSVILISDKTTLFIVKNLNYFFDSTIDTSTIEEQIERYNLNVQIETGKYLNSKIFLGGCENGDLLIFDCKNKKKHIFKGHEKSIYKIFVVNNSEDENKMLRINFKTVGREGQVYNWILNYKDFVDIKSKKLHYNSNSSIDCLNKPLFFLNVSDKIEVQIEEKIVNFNLDDKLLKMKEFNRFIGFINQQTLIFISLEKYKNFKFMSLFTDLIMVFETDKTVYFLGTKNYKSLYFVAIEIE
ncbi:hypothetical protein CDIK_0959 [Cucumispora dikerogammari]|nr:hypothetical protein CDIK_0959 [Cucumispora dikerogammari]